MFDALIKECRDRLQTYGWGRNLLFIRRRNIARSLRRQGIGSEHIEDYRELIEHGQVVWATCAQVNGLMVEPGRADLPGNTIFGLDPYFDTHPLHLLKIAHSISSLKDTEPGDPVCARVASVMTDESNFVSNWRLPFKLSDGHAAYMTSTQFHRNWLPGKMLGGALFPLIVCPERSIVSMLLPLDCWPGALRDNWDVLHEQPEAVARLKSRRVSEQQLADDVREARENPHRALRPEDLVPGASSAILSLTPQCARYVRELARTHKLPKNWHLVVGGNSSFRTMEMSVDDVSASHQIVISEGISISIPSKSLGELRGTVVHYMRTPIGVGFVFVSPT